ncbi:MAG: hypothetical protein KJ687_04775, partial [Proteobacteria bacterium]|nr:hypothetical protein [Pseudomonadota bacterium]
MEYTSRQEIGALSNLLKLIEESKNISARGDVKIKQLRIWCARVGPFVKKIYGSEHEVTKSQSYKLITENINAGEELEKRTHLLESYVAAIEKIGVNAFVNRNIGSRV